MAPKRLRGRKESARVSNEREGESLGVTGEEGGERRRKRRGGGRWTRQQGNGLRGGAGGTATVEYCLSVVNVNANGCVWVYFINIITGPLLVITQMHLYVHFTVINVLYHHYTIILL